MPDQSEYVTHYPGDGHPQCADVGRNHRWPSNDDADRSIAVDYCRDCRAYRWSDKGAEPCPKGEQS